MKQPSQIKFLSLSLGFCALLFGSVSQADVGNKGAAALSQAVRILGKNLYNGRNCSLTFQPAQPGSVLLGVPVIGSYELSALMPNGQKKTLDFYFIGSTITVQNGNILKFETIQTIQNEDPETGHSSGTVRLVDSLTLAGNGATLTVAIHNGLTQVCTFTK